VPGEEPTPLRPLDHPGGNLREGQLADLIREEVDQRELASDGHVDAAPRADFTELVR